MTMLPPPMAGPGQVPHSKDHRNIKLENTKISTASGSAKVQSTLVAPINPNKVYFVDLPMVDLARDVYEQAVKNRSSEINRFVSMKYPDGPTVRSIAHLIIDLKKCLTQEYIVARLFTKRQKTPADIAARWAITYSTKHMFLHRFLDKIRNLRTHIAIFSSPGERLDVLESLLKANNISYDRPGLPANKPVISPKSALRVTLLPTRQKRGHHNVAHAQLVIALDDTFRPSDDYVKRVRTDPHTNNITPIVILSITSSIEQIDLCFPVNMTSRERKCLLLRCIEHTVLEHKVGVANPNGPSVDASVTYLAQSLAAGVQELTIPEPLPFNEITSYLKLLAQFPEVPHTKDTPDKTEKFACSRTNLKEPQRDAPGEAEQIDGKYKSLDGEKHYS